MSWYTGFATYAINWGLVMFMVLPWGVRRIDPEDLGEGDDPGAPANPRILLGLPSPRWPLPLSSA